MSIGNFAVENGAENTEWPEPVKRAFLALCLIADEHDFSILCAIGFNRPLSRGGEHHLGAFFSPRASTNPHRREMCQDMAELFRKAVERETQ
jgi:hypothetical protein